MRVDSLDSGHQLLVHLLAAKQVDHVQLGLQQALLQDTRHLVGRQPCEPEVGELKQVDRPAQLLCVDKGQVVVADAQLA